jgi:two-component system CheB/CheR fusion protein
MSEAAARADPAFDALLEFLAGARGFDFTAYKPASLMRRVRRRMDQVGCGSFADYIDYLEVHPDEYEQLFNAILINVTEFFRDGPVWEHLRETTLPAVLAGKGDDEPIRVWSAGCATGQEPCSLAILLAEHLGLDAYVERVKIYATDVDEGALAVARQATYGPRETESLSAELRDRYFVAQRQRLAFRHDLRRALIFGRNDLLADAPISRLDLLVCRNTLMYLTTEAQGRILRHFQFALRDGGALVLGRSEMMTASRELFDVDDLKKRIFRKRSGSASLQARVIGMANDDVRPDVDEHDRLTHEAALDAGPHAQLIVSPAGVVTFANATARALFGLGHDAIGRALDEQPVGHAPADLRGAVDKTLEERRRVVLGEVLFAQPRGGTHQLAVSLLPLLDEDGAPLAVSVMFEDVSRFAELQGELDHNRRDLEAAYEELESTIDELETTNEELQSANEELQTTNEELQSTNEELETMNEELQSTNAELETLNDELRLRTGELNRVNEFLEVILASLNVAVAALDRRGRVQMWNRGAENLWGARTEEVVEQHFLALDIGLGPERLASALRSVLAGGEAERLLLEAVNRRGRPIRCGVSVMPLRSGPAADAEVHGTIVLMQELGAGPSELGMVEAG